MWFLHHWEGNFHLGFYSVSIKKLIINDGHDSLREGIPLFIGWYVIIIIDEVDALVGHVWNDVNLWKEVNTYLSCWAASANANPDPQ